MLYYIQDIGTFLLFLYDIIWILPAIIYLVVNDIRNF